MTLIDMTTADKRIPQAGQTWQHWKIGVRYVVDSIDFLAKEVKKGQSIFIGKQEKPIAAHDIPANSDIVIYRSNSSQKLYARSLDNFLEVLPQGGNEGSTRWHRFELVQESDRNA